MNNMTVGKSHKDIPPDSVKVWGNSSWTILVSRSNNSVYFEITDYHAEPLKLTKRELHDLGKVANGRLKRFRRRGK